VVPVSATSGKTAMLAESRPYSVRIPGVTNPRVAAFMTSMTNATPTRAICILY